MINIAVLADPGQKSEFLEMDHPQDLRFHWASDFTDLTATKADGYFDLLFRNDEARKNDLKQLLPKPVFIHSVIDPLSRIQHAFIRINAWPGFLKRKIKEVVLPENDLKNQLQHFLNLLGWEYKLVPDITGMIAARVITMIVNEGYFALESAVSTKSEIDMAMRSGTNYPMGPFQWSEHIGLENIYELLKNLCLENSLYQPCKLIVQEVLAKGGLTQ